MQGAYACHDPLGSSDFEIQEKISVDVQVAVVTIQESWAVII